MTFCQRTITVVGSLALMSGAAVAQTATSRNVASITGSVFDSLVTNAPLTGAQVTVDGTGLTGLTDAHGGFRLDSVPAGRAVVRFYHALLDSLEFGAAPVVVTVGDSGAVNVRLATPSAATLHARLCPGTQPAASGVVVGVVRDVDHREALPDASIVASWSEWAIGASGLVRTERRASAQADANGSFALCGVPNDVAVIARASAAGHTTGFVDLDLAQRRFAVRNFAVSLTDPGSMTSEQARMDSALARGDSVVSLGGATVAGVVRGTHGRIVDRAQVGMLGSPAAVRTSSEGQYALLNVPAGTQTIDARAIGFAPRRVTVDVRTGERRALDVILDDAKAQDLAPVNIVGRGMKLDRTGFDDRRKAGLGQYITDHDIERRGVFDTQQALWNVLGARVVWTGSANVVVFTREANAVAPMRQGSGFDDVAFTKSRATCTPVYWIDGSWFGPLGDDLDRVVRPYQIRGIEVYVNPGLAPSTYRRGDEQCGLVLIWTKPPQPKQIKSPGP